MADSERALQIFDANSALEIAQEEPLCAEIPKNEAYTLLAKHAMDRPLGTSGSLQNKDVRDLITAQVKKLKLPVEEVQRQVMAFVVEQLHNTLCIENEEIRMTCLEGLKCFLSGFSIFIQQSRELHLAALMIHAMSSNKTLASAARYEYQAIKNQERTKLDEW